VVLVTRSNSAGRFIVSARRGAKFRDPGVREWLDTAARVIRAAACLVVAR
jgi:hypothetical protein